MKKSFEKERRKKKVLQRGNKRESIAYTDTHCRIISTYFPNNISNDLLLSYF